ncbi:Polysaccharide biosynthesis protein [anaerobic digester metagenome]
MTILQQLIGYVSLYFVSRYMGPEPLGIMGTSLAFIAIFMNFSDMGFSLAHYKKVSEGKDLGKCIGTFASVKISLTFLASMIYLAALFFMKLAGKKLPIPEAYSVILYIVLISAIIGNIASVAQNTFSARVEKAKEWTSMISAKIVTTILNVAVALLGLGVVFLAWSNFVGTLVSAVIAFWFLRKLPFKKFDKKLFNEYSRYALPSFIIGISSSLAMQLDIIFISMLSDVEQVGYYTGAKSVVLVVNFISVIFISLLLPTYSKMHANNDIEGIRTFARKIERYISFPLMALGLFIFFFSSPIQQMLLGPSFAASSLIIKILVLNAMLLIFAQPYTAQLMGMNKIKLATILSVVLIVSNVIFYILFIPARFHGFALLGLGSAGAAASLLVSNFIGTAMFRYYAFRLTGSKPNYIIIAHLFCSILVFAPLYYFLQDWKWISNFFVLGSIAVAGGCVYLLLLSVTKLFRRNDLRFYLDVINPGKLGNYVKNEIKDQNAGLP